MFFLVFLLVFFLVFFLVLPLLPLMPLMLYTVIFIVFFYEKVHRSSVRCFGTQREALTVVHPWTVFTNEFPSNQRLQYSDYLCTLQVTFQVILTTYDTDSQSF